MIKVSFLISSLCNEGPVNVMYNIVKYIDYTKYDVSIVTFIPEKESTRISEFRKLPVSIYQLAKTKTLNPVKLFLALRKEIKAISPDLLHAHCPRSLYLMHFLPKVYKRIYTIHNYPGDLQRILYGRLKGNIVIKLNHFFTKRTDCPIGCAENISTSYKEIQGWDILSISNGSSLPVWNGNAEYKQGIRKKLNLQENIRYFIFIGRFSNEKNPDKLIHTFKNSTRKDIGIIMLGDGPMWNDLKKEETDRIILPGFKTNVYDYLIASDYYISASDGEGLANTLLESMTIGLPMLLSDITSHKDVLSKMNKTVGYLFNQKNGNDLTDKIDKITLLDEKEVAIEIKHIFIQYYTAKKMSLAYQTVYSNLNSK